MTRSILSREINLERLRRMHLNLFRSKTGEIWAATPLLIYMIVIGGERVCDAIVLETARHVYPSYHQAAIKKSVAVLDK